MGDDRGHQAGPDSSPSHGRATGSTVLTPPVGIPVVPGEAGALLGPDRVSRAPDGSVVPLIRGVPAPPDVSRPTAPGAVVAPCLCGHPPDAHRHWRPGTDCGTCGKGACTAYRTRGGGPLRWLFRSVGLVR
jgi:hypothetical protein